MTNAIKGETTFKIGEKDYVLLFDVDALCRLEESHGLTLIDIQQRVSKGSVVAIRALLWAGLLRHHEAEKIDLRRAGEMITELGGFVPAAELVGEALRRALPEAEPKDSDGTDGGDPADPPEAAAGERAPGTGRRSTRRGSSSN